MKVFVAKGGQVFPVETDSDTTARGLLEKLGVGAGVQLRDEDGGVLQPDEPVGASVRDGDHLYATAPINVAEKIR